MEHQQQHQQQPPPHGTAGQRGAPSPSSSHVRPMVAVDGQRKSSIETEPRTLYEEQMVEAKDAAIDVIETKDPDEAMEIFTTPSEECVIPTVPTPVYAIPHMTVVDDQFEDAQMHVPIKLPSAPF